MIIHILKIGVSNLIYNNSCYIKQIVSILILLIPITISCKKNDQLTLNEWVIKQSGFEKTVIGMGTDIITADLSTGSIHRLNNNQPGLADYIGIVNNLFVKIVSNADDQSIKLETTDIKGNVIEYLGYLNISAPHLAKVSNNKIYIQENDYGLYIFDINEELKISEYQKLQLNEDILDVFAGRCGTSCASTDTNPCCCRQVPSMVPSCNDGFVSPGAAWLLRIG
jgi:hypothetical protein